FAAFAIVQPDCAGVIPAGPSSWYGVARPAALSGFAGTMIRHDTFATAAAAAAAVGDAVAVAAVLAVAVGHGVAAAVAVVAAAVATGVATVPVGVGATADALALGAAAAAAVVVADGVAQAPATFAALLAPKTLLKPGTISIAMPTPITAATTPAIAMSRVRDCGSNLRSWLNTLLR
ncbi:MAG TPA: hypothetical protein VMV92_32280, partial [Streptosporangiaceae bacterium]|nr:hypothetical protein [Streptosporangiaceae bacterium]